MLFSKTYRNYLRPDVKIIAGKRTASISSASKLLAGVAEFYHESLLEEKNFLTNAPERQETLLNKICAVIKMLRSAINHVVTGQVDSGGNLNLSDKIVVNSGGKTTLESINEQLQILFYIKQKIQKLS